MNREIASAPEKSEASFCERRTAAVSRPSMEACAHFPDWSLNVRMERSRGEGEVGSAAWCTLKKDWPINSALSRYKPVLYVTSSNF